jgi:hypothetical protein
MLHYPLRSPGLTHLLLQLKMKKPPSSLRGSNTSTNRFRISYRSLMTSTSSAMINTKCHKSFRWATKFGCICRKKSLLYPIGSFSHPIMCCKPSPWLWVIMILSSTFLLSFAYTQCSMCITFDLISHHYWTPQR